MLCIWPAKYTHAINNAAAYSWKVFSQKPPTIRVIPTIRVRLVKCALVDLSKEYLEFIHVIDLKGGKSKNFW